MNTCTTEMDGLNNANNKSILFNQNKKLMTGLLGGSSVIITKTKKHCQNKTITKWTMTNTIYNAHFKKEKRERLEKKILQLPHLTSVTKMSIVINNGRE